MSSENYEELQPHLDLLTILYKSRVSYPSRSAIEKSDHLRPIGCTLAQADPQITN